MQHPAGSDLRPRAGYRRLAAPRGACGGLPSRWRPSAATLETIRHTPRPPGYQDSNPGRTVDPRPTTQGPALKTGNSHPNRCIFYQLFGCVERSYSAGHGRTKRNESLEARRLEGSRERRDRQVPTPEMGAADRPTREAQSSTRDAPHSRRLSSKERSRRVAASLHAHSRLLPCPRTTAADQQTSGQAHLPMRHADRPR